MDAAIIAEAKEANSAASDTLKESYQQKEASYKKDFEGKLEAMKNNMKIWYTSILRKIN